MTNDFFLLEKRKIQTIHHNKLALQKTEKQQLNNSE